MLYIIIGLVVVGILIITGIARKVLGFAISAFFMAGVIAVVCLAAFWLYLLLTGRRI